MRFSKPQICGLIGLSKVSVEESEDFTTDMCLSGFNMIEDTLVGGKDNITELSGWEDVINKLLEILKLEVESW